MRVTPRLFALSNGLAFYILVLLQVLFYTYGSNMDREMGVLFR